MTRLSVEDVSVRARTVDVHAPALWMSPESINLSVDRFRGVPALSL